MTRLLALILVLSIPAVAQDSLEQKTKQLQQDLSRPVAQWDDAFVISTFEKYLNIYLDLLWTPGIYNRAAAFLPKNRPKVRVLVAGEFRTPYMNKDEVVVPVECLRYLAAIGFLVGHDAYVQDHTIDLPYPLLSAPYRKSAIIPRLEPLAASVDVGAFMALQTYLICPPTDARCAAVQNPAVAGLFLFAILHELSHELLHHKTSEEGVNLANELAADKNATMVLSVVAEEFTNLPESLRKEVQFALAAGPVVFFEVECSRVGPMTAFSRQREEALLNWLPRDTRTDVRLFIEPDRSADNIQHVKIGWNEPPSLLLIDGIVVPAAEVSGKVLTLAGGKHTILGLRSDSIAWVQTGYESPEVTVPLQLAFKPFAPADEAIIGEARRKKQWLEVLLRTTDGNLQPKDAHLSLSHFEALHRLGLDQYIHVDDWNVLPRESWTKVSLWQQAMRPLSSWY
jgi:hypothetical protein